MIVYHGSTEIIKNPDVVHSKKYLDFGRGFYIIWPLGLDPIKI